MSKLTGKYLLDGKTIICTYPVKPDDDFYQVILPLNANLVEMPLIKIVPITFTLPERLEWFDWLIFTSKNALTPFFSRFKCVRNKIAVIGKPTGAELLKLGYTPDFIGSGQSGVQFLEELKEVLVSPQRLLFVLGMLAPNLLPNGLSALCDVSRVNVYETRKPDTINEDALKRIGDNNYDVIIVTSPSAVHNLFLLLNGLKQGLRLVSIGQATTATILSYGIEPVATAQQQSYKGLAETVVDFLCGE